MYSDALGNDDGQAVERLTSGSTSNAMPIAQFGHARVVRPERAFSRIAR